VSDGDGAAGGHRGAGRKPVQERGRPHLPGVPPLGDRARSAVPARGRRWAGAPVPSAAQKPPAHSPGRQGRDHRPAQGARPRRARGRRGHHRRSPAATPRPRRGAGGSTIWRILSARGFVTPQPHKRPKSSWQRFAAEQPNERWQLDITHYRLADGSEVEILNIIDDHSRLCVASTARRVFTAGDVPRHHSGSGGRIRTCDLWFMSRAPDLSIRLTGTPPILQLPVRRP
jgi:transposase InsO family protein